jgi:hypothetical protein
MSMPRGASAPVIESTTPIFKSSARATVADRQPAVRIETDIRAIVAVCLNENLIFIFSSLLLQLLDGDDGFSG